MLNGEVSYLVSTSFTKEVHGSTNQPPKKWPSCVHLDNFDQLVLIGSSITYLILMV